MSLESELLEIEGVFWQSSGDIGFWGEHFNDDGVIALPTGLMGKETVVNSQQRTKPWDDFSIKDAHVVDLGDDVASISYRATARRESESEYSAVVTSVYARRNGEWQLMVHQQTPIED
jgi:ketosteroid isomerase-like protein